MIPCTLYVWFPLTKVLLSRQINLPSHPPNGFPIRLWGDEKLSRAMQFRVIVEGTYYAEEDGERLSVQSVPGSGVGMVGDCPTKEDEQELLARLRQLPNWENPSH